MRGKDRAAGDGIQSNRGGQTIMREHVQKRTNGRPTWQGAAFHRITNGAPKTPSSSCGRPLRPLWVSRQATARCEWRSRNARWGKESSLSPHHELIIWKSNFRFQQSRPLRSCRLERYTIPRTNGRQNSSAGTNATLGNYCNHLHTSCQREVVLAERSPTPPGPRTGCSQVRQVPLTSGEDLRRLDPVGYVPSTNKRAAGLISLPDSHLPVNSSSILDAAGLEEGMVFTIKPAIYLPGFGGVQLEENLVVAASDCESLCPIPQRME